jgi:hypothetical protein
MLRTPLHHLFRPRHRSRRGPIRRERNWPRLALEALEDRTLLAAPFVALGPLRFYNDNWLINSSEWTAGDPTVTIGFAPTQGERFLGLLQVALQNSGTFKLDTRVAPPKFTLTDAVLNTVVPAGQIVGGEIKIVDHRLDSIDLFYLVEQGDGIPVADTGLFLTYIDASVQNLTNPRDLVISGKIAFNCGPQVSILGKSATLFRAEGDFTVSRHELVVSGSYYQGAVQTGTDANGLPVYSGALGGGGTLTLDWEHKSHVMSALMTLYGGVFQLQGVFAFDTSGDIVLGAKASVNVPSEIPFIGGKELGQVDFLFEYHHDDREHSFFAAWVSVDLLITDVKVGFEYDLDNNFRVIGGDTIDKFQDCFTNPEQCLTGATYTYFTSYQPPAAATLTTLSENYPQGDGTHTVSVTLPDGTVVQQNDFDIHKNGITLVPQLSSATRITVQVVGSADHPDRVLPPGTYRLTLSSTDGFDMHDVHFSATAHYPPPAVTTIAPTVPTPGNPVVTVNLAGTVDPAFTDPRVSLYVDKDNTGYDGMLIATARNLPVHPDVNGVWSMSPRWDLTGLLPGNYYVYAIINDGTNVPVRSAYSTTATPVNPPLYGFVRDVGRITIHFTRETDNAQVNGIELTPAGGVAVNAGGGAVGRFGNDSGFDPSQTATVTDPIDVSHVVDPAPQAV